MDAKFDEVRCPCCGGTMRTSHVEIGHDVFTNKTCNDCETLISILIPNTEKFDYKLTRTPK